MICSHEQRVERSGFPPKHFHGSELAILDSKLENVLCSVVQGLACANDGGREGLLDRHHSLPVVQHFHNLIIRLIEGQQPTRKVAQALQPDVHLSTFNVWHRIRRCIKEGVIQRELLGCSPAPRAIELTSSPIGEKVLHHADLVRSKDLNTSGMWLAVQADNRSLFNPRLHGGMRQGRRLRQQQATHEPAHCNDTKARKP
mmetsp:Transcript_8112/g.22598  ORF Transcript_8112/g.22598 Transcript_8112/m.22598 type:complete len:200 (+) Transcript_8112:374-973(+)